MSDKRASKMYQSLTDYFQSLKWFQWLLINGQLSVLYPYYYDFEERFLNARLDWVTMGVL